MPALRVQIPQVGGGVSGTGAKPFGKWESEEEGGGWWRRPLTYGWPGWFTGAIGPFPLSFTTVPATVARAVFLSLDWLGSGLYAHGSFRCCKKRLIRVLVLLRSYKCLNVWNAKWFEVNFCDVFIVKSDEVLGAFLWCFLKK